jgi:hypothetical protein
VCLLRVFQGEFCGTLALTVFGAFIMPSLHVQCKLLGVLDSEFPADFHQHVPNSILNTPPLPTPTQLLLFTAIHLNARLEI